VFVYLNYIPETQKEIGSSGSGPMYLAGLVYHESFSHDESFVHPNPKA